MRLRDSSALPDDIARELAAIDAALAGEPVEPRLREIAELSLALRDERPLPAAAVAERLDALAASGFARADQVPADRATGADPAAPTRSARRGSLAALASRVTPEALRTTGGSRRLLPVAGGACAVLVAVAIGLSAGGDGGGPAFNEQATTALESAQPPTAGSGSQAGSAASGSGDAAARSKATGQAAPNTDEAAPATPTAPPAAAAVPGASLPQPTPTVPQTLDTARRSVERGAQLRLATSPRRLDEVSAGVLNVTDAVGGIVRSSAIDSRSGGGSASFQLEIPSARLQIALARLSQLAAVRSRNEGSIDVTEQVTFARNRVVALRAERRALLRRLASAPSLDEATRIRDRLRSIEARLRAARAERASLRRRTTYSNVYVEVVTERRKAGAGGSWTPGDAVGDAARILELALGVTVVALAALAPLLLAGLIAWPLVVATRRRRRERALDASARPAA